MKKFAAALLAFALLISGAVVWAESETTTDTGIWEKRAYVDEFDLPTDEYYISNKEPIVGKFSNSATTDSPLYVYIYVNDASYVSIRLIEYGSNIVKNPYSDGRDYDVAMMDTFGERYYFNGTMSGGQDRIFFSQKVSATIIEALRYDGIVRFVITEKDSPLTEYSFSIADTSGFDALMPYRFMGPFKCNDGLHLVSKGVLRFSYGFIDTNGNLTIPCEYNSASSFSEGFAAVQNDDGQWGFIDTEGNLVIPYEYDGARSFREGLASIKVNEKWGFIDTEGNLVIPCEYDTADDFSEGLVPVEKNGEWGFIDVNNSLTIPYEYGYACPFYNGYARVQKDGKWGFIDMEGNLVIPCEYDTADDFGEGLAPVEKDGKWGFIDTNNSLVVPYEYDTANSFSNGRARVERDDKWGYIDTTGELVIPCEYDSAYTFSDGVAEVLKHEGEHRAGVIDTNGNILIPCEYDQAAYGEGSFIMEKGNELIIISRDEVQPGWEEELAAHERELAEQEEARRAEAEAQRMLMEHTDKETIQSVQAALNEAGYDCGTPDGIAGKNTQAAISAFQQDNGLSETGTVTHELLLALNIIDGE